MADMDYTTEAATEWPKATNNNGARGRKPSPKHDALAKALTDGEMLRLTPDDDTNIQNFQTQIRLSMNRRGLRVKTRIGDDMALYVRLAPPRDIPA